MPDSRITLEIHFIDGKVITLRYRPDSDAEVPPVLLKDFKFERIALETEGDLVIIPMDQVRYLRATPAPAGLPAKILRNVEFIEK
jgi:hypothetical protein